MMPFLNRVQSFLRMIWPLLAIVAFGVGLVASYKWRIRVAERRGAASVIARADTVLRTQRDTVRVYTARTDTVVRHVTRQAARVDSVAARVPDTARVLYPVVDTLIVEVGALTDSTRVLLSTLTAERTQRDTLTAVLSRSIVARDDAIRALSKRPTRKRLWAQTVLVGGVAYLAGRQR